MEENETIFQLFCPSVVYLVVVMLLYFPVRRLLRAFLADDDVDSFGTDEEDAMDKYNQIYDAYNCGEIDCDEAVALLNEYYDGQGEEQFYAYCADNY